MDKSIAKGVLGHMRRAAYKNMLPKKPEAPSIEIEVESGESEEPEGSEDEIARLRAEVEQLKAMLAQR